MSNEDLLACRAITKARLGIKTMIPEELPKGLDNLKIWRQAINIAVDLINEVIPYFPSEEKFGLSSQLRRSAQSVPANIAEGYGRFYYQEGIRFCYLARGSLEETYTHLYLAKQLGYISQEVFQKYSMQLVDLRKLLNGFVTYLKRSKRGATEPGNVYQIRDQRVSYPEEFQSFEAS